MDTLLHRLLAGVTLVTSLSIVACSKDGPTQPPTAEVELVAVSGSGQCGPTDQLLIDPLIVAVQQLGDGRPA